MGILQGKARGGEEESVLMHDLKPFRILISLLDKPELGEQRQPLSDYVRHMTTCHTALLFFIFSMSVCVSTQALPSWRMSSLRCSELYTHSVEPSWIFKTRVRLVKTKHTSAGQAGARVAHLISMWHSSHTGSRQ